ncbi:pathogenesis-related protein 1B [Biomphalaria pfeifferi]|uniref:Pathogenesis-related protein 1B n=1 Tax=Biomphalaria pfeifferi TaxID=112525 RepID=A0AAD8BW08_BIOPF|nr:pathogenesis-related protein 1B [Biomphalaria pfeifferi]
MTTLRSPPTPYISWVKEIQYVDLPTWNCFTRQDKKTCGHYSQVVWKNTQKVGCAIIHCKTEIRTLSFVSTSPVATI